MSIANENNRVSLLATGGQTVFPYDFKIEAEDEILVYQIPTTSTPHDATNLLTLTTDYTLSGIGDDAGGNITLVSGATLNDRIIAIRAIDLDQPDSYNTGEDNAENYEASIDRLVMRIQKLEEIISRCAKYGATGERRIAVQSISIADGGSGYAALDSLTVTTGACADPATILVTSVAAGVITGATLIDSGTYLIGPDTTDVPVLGGTGSGALFDLTSS